MRIPKKFTLAGIPIRVIAEPLADKKSVLGEARYMEQVIAMDLEAAPRHTTEQAFCHELVHWIFFVLNEPDLRNNEKLVDTIAHLLYQFLETQDHDDASDTE